ncbi:MAG: GDSL-type esterase/lipase family protein [Candidatus Saccharibacteria bacterium]
MKRILIYGDSIPWGLVPCTKFERYEYDKRWPGILQSKLGNDYQIIEECLCARTIDSNDPRPGFEGRNGMDYLSPCLDSHYPIDVIILSLGLNELKSIYEWSPLQVAEKMSKMIKLIKNRKPNFHDSNAKIILLSQPFVSNTGYWGELWIGSSEKSRELYGEYKEIAKQEGIDFIDLSEITPDKKDGVHINNTGHNIIAEIVSKYIKQL